jgi:hypothetical protein
LPFTANISQNPAQFQPPSGPYNWLKVSLFWKGSSNVVRRGLAPFLLKPENRLLSILLT